jgi:hypothetical protein
VRAGWLFTCWCLIGCGAEIGDDEDTDARPGGIDAAAVTSDAAAPDAAPPEMQTTVFAVPDITDTFVRLSDPTFNFGGRDRMCADTTTDDRRILFHIDVSALPPGTEVVEATMHLWTGTSTNDLSAQTFSFYPVLEAWDEGNQDGVAGAASWNERQAGTAWTVAGAGVGSRGEQVIGSFTPDALDTEYAVPLDPSVVGGWIANAASNFGLVVVAAGSDGGCFDTTENATAGKHPTLVVTWIAP